MANLLLHGIGESGQSGKSGSGVPPLSSDKNQSRDGSATFSATLDSDLPVVTKDALAGKHGEYEIVLANPLRQKEQRDRGQRGGRVVQGIAHHQPGRVAAPAALQSGLRRFKKRFAPCSLGDHEQQTAQFPPAHLHHPQAAWPGGGGVAG